MLKPIHLAKIEEMYSCYKSTIRYKFFEIELRANAIPDELLNEIRAFNDHLSRVYDPKISDEQIEIELSGANTHIKRLTYDCFKYLFVIIQDEIDEYEYNMDIKTIKEMQDGDLYHEMKRLKTIAFDTAYFAKKQEIENEIKGDHPSNTDNYERALIAYKELLDFYMKNEIEISGAKRKSFWTRTLKRTFSGAWWVILAAISALIGILLDRLIR